MGYEVLRLSWKEIIIYLRKSRSDDPTQTVEEVLAKHETQLQEYAERELGGRIPEENIYREVVSGESIEDRVEIKKVLARIEDPAVKGVLVVDPQRLSRGDLKDCGHLIDALQFTHTQVVTLMMTYNLENKMERKFFQDELLRGRDFYEYTREILFRGRVAAAKRGIYNGRYAPYGYKKIQIAGNNTLEIVEEEAEVVRLVFDLYAKEGLAPYPIACRLNEMGVKAPRGEKWVKDTIRHIVRNEHYIGKIVFNKYKDTPVLENGEIKKKRLAQPPENVILAEGKHKAIIDMATWELAQERVASNPRVKFTYDLSNPYSSVLFCAKCGRVLTRHPYKNAVDRYECRARPRCYKSVKATAIDEAILDALENAELPALQLRVKNKDGDALKIQQRLLKKLEKQMEEYRDQEDKQYDFLETGRYTQDVFDRRNAALREKMEECQAQIYKAKASMPKSVNYEERVAALQTAIDMLKDPTATAEEKNRSLKAIVDKIEYSSVPSDKENRRRQTKNGVSPFTLTVQLKL